MTTTYTIAKSPVPPTTFYVAGNFKRFTKKRLEQAADDLDAAAKLLKFDNWTVGEWCDRDGRMCAQGAIAKAAVGDPTAYHKERARAAICLADEVVFSRDTRYDEAYAISILDFNDSAPSYIEGGEALKKHLAKIRKALRTAARAARAKAETMKR